MKSFNRDAGHPALARSSRPAQRLIWCFGLSLLLHAGLSTLRPGEHWGLPSDTPGSAAAPTLNVTLAMHPATDANHVQAQHSAVSGPSQTSQGTPSASTTKQELPPAINGLFAGPWYYAAQYLHRRPSPLRPIRPDYPPLADDAVHTVRILLLLSASGTVDSYRVIDGESDTPFAASVVNAFTTAVYAPGLIAGMPVKSQLLAEVVFNPGNGQTQMSLSVPQGSNVQAEPLNPAPGPSAAGK